MIPAKQNNDLTSQPRVGGKMDKTSGLGIDDEIMGDWVADGKVTWINDKRSGDQPV